MIKFYRMEVTPDWAKAALAETQRINRPRREPYVVHLAEQITDGLWLETHECIAFDKDGMLIDGQHRLAAVVLANRSVFMNIAENCDPETFKKIGQGKSRNSVDLYVIEFKQRFGGMPPRAKHVASAASRMLSGLSEVHVSPEEVAVHALKHQKLIHEYLLELYHGNNKTIYGTTTLAALAKASLYFGREKIQPILTRLATQTWLGPTDPLKQMYDRLVRAKVAEGRDRKSKLMPSEQYAITVSAIRAALQGRLLSRVEITTQDIGDADVDKKPRNG